jgi:hypothetical protein
MGKDTAHTATIRGTALKDCGEKDETVPEMNRGIEKAA